jgi:hypothetical protein
MKFQTYKGSWTDLRNQPELVEVDFHFGSSQGGGGYREHMAEIHEKVLSALSSAQEAGERFVLFTHGKSTSGPGRVTARSVVRGIMRSPAATQFIVRAQCVQHESAFLAKIRSQRD